MTDKQLEAVGKILGILFTMMLNVFCVKVIWNGLGVDLFAVHEITLWQAFTMVVFVRCFRGSKS